jgi:hypothetical protein
MTSPPARWADGSPVPSKRPNRPAACRPYRILVRPAPIQLRDEAPRRRLDPGGQGIDHAGCALVERVKISMTAAPGSSRLAEKMTCLQLPFMFAG